MSAPKQYDLMTGWRVEEFANYQGHADLVGARIITDCEIVAEVVGAVICGDWGRHDLHTKRAHLIAAAPDLLESCVEFLPILERQLASVNLGGIADESVAVQTAQARVNRMRGAIAKATGEGA